MRKLLGVAATLVSALLLAGCAPASQADLVNQLQPVCKPFTTGKGLDSIKVNPDLNEVPATKIASGLTSSAIETKIITEGTGSKIVGNQLITMEYEGLNGGTGAVFESSKHDGSDVVAQYLTSGQKPDFCHALSGVRVGSRVAILFPAQLAHNGEGVASLNIGANDSIVFVLDIVSAALPHALGEAKPAQSGFPAISFDPKTSIPGFSFSTEPAPTQLKTEKLIAGNGEIVKAGDTVTLNYSGIVYGATTVFDSSWESGQPAQFELTKGGLIDGFYKTLVGSKVGDRIVTIIPPDQGYGATEQGAIPANSTLVFVIDVLGTKHK